MRLLLLTSLALTGCTETGISSWFGGNRDGDATDTDGGVGSWDTRYPPVAGELCNGIDDDGDGDIDEGHPDMDGDGIADCVDTDCAVKESEAQEVGIDEECAPNQGEPPLEPWRVVEEWSWRGFMWAPEFKNVITPPVVGSLNDDNGDGKIDDDDDPDVVFVAFASFDEDVTGGMLVAVDGKSGSVHWVVEDVYALGGVAIGDVNGDSRPDVVTFSGTQQVTAFDGDGERLWRAKRGVGSNLPLLTLADVDGNGVVDVIADNMRVDGRTGEIINWYGVQTSVTYRMPAVADIDLDGNQEVVLGNAVFSADGTRRWMLSSYGQYGHWSAILEADDDPQAEVAMIANGRLHIFNHDGSTLFEVASGNDHPGAPCVADFDGDGEAEIAWASNNRFVVHNLDGSEVWARKVNDNTGLLATCSGFDFDGNGTFEILYNDNERAYIFDGRTGDTLYENAGHASTTIWEYPTIADIDKDGSAEILVASNTWNAFDGWSGVTVLGHVHNQWMPAGPTWNSHDYSVTNVNDDSTIPQHPEPSWQKYNVYRARPAMTELVVDLQPNILDVCFAGCMDDSVASISVQVYNAGSNNSAVGVPVALYARDGEYLELIGVKRLAKRVAAGWVSDTLVFDVFVGQLGPDGFVVKVDDDGTGDEVHPNECDEENNSQEWTDLPCNRN